MQARHTEQEVVELLAAIGRWPAGTIGTVVKADEVSALVEISDDRGHGLDFVGVPQAALGAARGSSEMTRRGSSAPDPGC